jgi:hypothetical protein
MDGDPYREPRHVNHGIVGHLVMTTSRHLVEPGLRHDVKAYVTMKEPIAGTIWHEAHRHRREGPHLLGDDHAPIVGRIDRI